MTTSRYAVASKMRGLWGSVAGGLRTPLDNSERASDRFHAVVSGDRVDLLANAYLGDPNLWWVICDWNDIKFPLSLPVGATLRIPSQETLAALL